MTLYLPLAQEEVPAETKKLTEKGADGVASARVVLVDDNDEVRAVTAAFLEDAGFRVEQAKQLTGRAGGA
ncbi:hypothetical protein ACU4GR_00930 [Methylobacterium oryzae CBMB20]